MSQSAGILFSKSIPTSAMMNFCRMSRVGLDAGLSVSDVFQQQARRGPLPVRPFAGRVPERLSKGESLKDAVQPERDRLPPLFVALTGVGEETGHLTDSFRELEDYFEQQYTLRKNFLIQII